MTHFLQTHWHDETNEKAYASEIESLIHAGELDAAQERLLADIASLETPMAGTCTSLGRRVEVDGWDEIVEGIAQFEGKPITAVHIMLSNPSDLAFEDRDEVFEPELELAFYTDEIFAFSRSDREALLTESLLPGRPWYGESEDMEVYAELTGMGNFNTALLRHKRQYHFRDQQHELDRANGLAVDIVPLPYIEFVLCAMLRGVVFHQVIRAKVESDGLPNNIPVIAGMFNMKVEFSSVYYPTEIKKIESAPVADLNVTIKRNMIEIPQEASGASIRQNAGQEPDEKRGFFDRILGRQRNAA
ncbi:MAG: hypothetical protein V3V15_04330 [Sphingorhabdus sp.]